MTASYQPGHVQQASGEVVIQRWLKRKIAVQAALQILTSACCVTTGSVVLLLTFFSAYVTVWIGSNFGASALSELIFNRPLRLQQNWLLGISSVFVVLLFIESLRTDREHSDAYPSAYRRARESLWVAARVSLAAKMITDLLFAGPRLMTASVGHFREALQAMQMDFENCARALTILAKKPSKMPATELAQLLAQCDPLVIFAQLRTIEGVLFITRGPIDLVLSETLREKLSHLFGMASEFHFAGTESNKSARPITPEESVCYELLGLSPSASLAEIKAAYRAKIKECHPDKFASHAHAFRQFAEDSAKSINRAYDILSARQTGDRGETTQSAA